MARQALARDTKHTCAWLKPKTSAFLPALNAKQSTCCPPPTAMKSGARFCTIVCCTLWTPDVARGPPCSLHPVHVLNCCAGSAGQHGSFRCTSAGKGCGVGCCLTHVTAWFGGKGNWHIFTSEIAETVQVWRLRATGYGLRARHRLGTLLGTLL